MAAGLWDTSDLSVHTNKTRSLWGIYHFILDIISQIIVWPTYDSVLIIFLALTFNVWFNNYNHCHGLHKNMWCVWSFMIWHLNMTAWRITLWAYLELWFTGCEQVSDNRAPPPASCKLTEGGSCCVWVCVFMWGLALFLEVSLLL